MATPIGSLIVEIAANSAVFRSERTSPAPRRAKSSTRCRSGVRTAARGRMSDPRSRSCVRSTSGSALFRRP